MDSVSAPETLVIRESLGGRRVFQTFEQPFLGLWFMNLGPSERALLDLCERKQRKETRVCLPPQIPRGTLGSRSGQVLRLIIITISQRMMGEFIRAKNVKRRRKLDRWVAQGSSHSAPLKSNTPLENQLLLARPLTLLYY